MEFSVIMYLWQFVISVLFPSVHSNHRTSVVSLHSVIATGLLLQKPPQFAQEKPQERRLPVNSQPLMFYRPLGGGGAESFLKQ
jgi:hypothetical protein